MKRTDSMEGKELLWPLLMAGIVSVVIILGVKLVPGVVATDGSWFLLLVLIPAILLGALLLPPSVPLTVALVLLESPFGLDTEVTHLTAYLTCGLILWTVLASSISVSRPGTMGSNVLQRKFWFFAAYGIVGALQGLRLGNPTEYVVGDLFQIEEFVIFFILVTRLVVDETTLRRVMMWVIGSTFVTSMLQLAGYGTLDSANPELEELEGKGLVTGRTIDLNAILVLLVLLSLYSAMRSGRQRAGIGLLVVATAANVVMSFTRGIWVAAVAAVLAFLFLLPRAQRRPLYRTAAVGALCIALGSGLSSIGSSSGGGLLAAVADRLLYGVTQVQQGLGGDVAVETRRFVEIATITPQIMKAPLLGNGLGGMYWIEALAFINAQGLGTIDFHYMHNLYLLVGFRLGLLGLATFVGLLYFYFRESIRGYRKMPEGPRQALVAGLIAGVAGEVVLSISSPTILNHPTSAMTACMMALTFALQNLPPGAADKRQPATAANHE